MWPSSKNEEDSFVGGSAVGGGVRAAVVQHTLQSLNTAGLYNDGPSPTVCACAHVHSSVTDVRTVVSVFLERQSSAACDLTLSRTVFFFFFFKLFFSQEPTQISG